MLSDPQVPSQKCAWRLGGLPYCALGPSGAPLNPISAPLWVSFCGSCGFFGCFGSPLARSERLLAPFGPPLAGLCPLWPLVGSLWVTLGRSLTPFALPLAPFGSPLGGLWFSLVLVFVYSHGAPMVPKSGLARSLSFWSSSLGRVWTLLWMVHFHASIGSTRGAADYFHTSIDPTCGVADSLALW